MHLLETLTGSFWAILSMYELDWKYQAFLFGCYVAVCENALVSFTLAYLC